MKYLKTFEKLFKERIKIYDLVHDKYKFIAKSNEIGVVMNIIESKIKRTTYLVAFNIDDDVISASFNKNELTKLTPEELADYEIVLNAKKYNL